MCGYFKAQKLKSCVNYRKPIRIIILYKIWPFHVRKIFKYAVWIQVFSVFNN